MLILCPLRLIFSSMVASAASDLSTRTSSRSDRIEPNRKQESPTARASIDCFGLSKSARKIRGLESANVLDFDVFFLSLFLEGRLTTDAGFICEVAERLSEPTSYLSANIVRSVWNAAPKSLGVWVLRRGGQQQHAAIVCAGFGVLTVAKNRAKARVDVTLTDSENQHPFQPSTYQGATVGLSPLRIR
jgi:hypothetical protein